MDAVMLPLILLSTSITSATAIEKSNKCGYDSCHLTKDGYVNVHIVAHSHDDVGWVKTVDEYYKHATSSIDPGGVKQILTSSFESLRKNKARRFIYVESAFFFKWWQEQSPTIKKQYKQLVNEGRLEFISGAWSVNDEATTNYQSIIDQFTLGLSKLNNTFGACGRPKVGWQIDPFGHSSQMASIFSQLGFDGLFLGRIDYEDKEQRMETDTMEMLWQASNSSEIFTSVLYNLYMPPSGFCFDVMCPDTFLDGHSWKWPLLVKYMDEQKEAYKTNNIILTMGGDFHYKHAERWFSSLDQLIKYGNEMQKHGSKYHLFYSTPSCYLKAVRDDARRTKIKWPVKTDDFFPYASEEESYWTGFYTSRATLKRFERLGNNFLQVCKQLYVLGNLTDAYKNKLDTLRKAMGVLQHHDAISGTEKQYVANDYAKQLAEGFAECDSITKDALTNIVLKRVGAKNSIKLPFQSCLLNNISQCEPTESSKSFIITVYNPLSRPVDHHLRVPVIKGEYSVQGPNGTDVPSQLVPIPIQVLSIPGRKSFAKYDLVFRAVKIPPLGFKSYLVKRTKTSCNTSRENSFTKKVSMRFSKSTGFLSKVIMNEKVLRIRQEFLYYKAVTEHPRPSGAYIFHPHGNAIPVTKKASYSVYKGTIVTEIHQTFNKWVSQIIRMYEKENYMEFQWLVGPLPDDGTGREVISRFSTNLNTKSTFYTDSNGREVLKRVRNFRPTWNLTSTQSISQNYYPVTSKILIRDPIEDMEVAVLTDRSQGGSSLKDGEIELMVHRNSYRDDDLGVEENLNEQAFGKPLVARGTHYLMVGPYVSHSQEGVAALERDLAQRKLLEAWTFISPIKDSSKSNYRDILSVEYSGLKSALPKNVQILTLEPWDDRKILLRLEHVFAVNEDYKLSKPVTVHLKHLFAAFRIVNLRETTLGGNQWLDESKPIKFREHTESPKSQQRTNMFRITLKPMQIRTFVVTIDRSM